MPCRSYTVRRTDAAMPPESRNRHYDQPRQTGYHQCEKHRHTASTLRRKGRTCSQETDEREKRCQKTYTRYTLSVFYQQTPASCCRNWFSIVYGLLGGTMVSMENCSAFMARPRPEKCL